MASTENKTINFYDRRTLLEMAEQLKRPTTFLLSTFFPRIREFASESVDLDIYKGSRRKIAYVKRRAEGSNVTKRGYETNSFIPPYLKPKVTILPSDLRKRVPGEDLFITGGLDSRAQDYIAEQIDEVDQQYIMAALEIQAMQAVYDGAVKAYDENGNLLATVSYDRAAALTFTESPLWSAGTANIPATGRKVGRLMRKESGFAPNMCVLGSDAVETFLIDAGVQKALSKDWSARGGLAYDLRPNGGVWLGYMDGIDYWAYEEYYVDPADGVEKLLIPAKKALYASTQAEGVQLYGALELIEQPMGARAIQTYTVNDPNAAIFQIHSAPLCLTKYPDAYSVVTVLT